MWNPLQQVRFLWEKNIYKWGMFRCLVGLPEDNRFIKIRINVDTWMKNQWMLEMQCSANLRYPAKKTQLVNVDNPIDT